jgi:signal transduction histidine kinase
MDVPFSDHSGAERLIATTRVAVAITALLIIWLDPFQPAQCAPLTSAALGAYTLYALALVWLARQTSMFVHRVRVITHAVDLAAFAFFTYLTPSLLSLFFLYYAFALLGAMLRWRWRGILWTTLAALITLISSGVYRVKAFASSDIELDHVVIGMTYIVMVALVARYTATYRQVVHNALSKLAVRPRVTVHEPRTLVRNELARAADILSAPRVLLIWEELEEPWMYVALWSPTEFRWTCEPPTAFEYLATAPLGEASFLCRDTNRPLPRVLYTSSTGLHHWRGQPLHPDMQKQFAIDAVLSSSLRGAVVEGRIFFLGKPGFTPNDLMISDYIAHQLAADLDQALLAERRQRAAITAERQRLVRNLHDGLLQSLLGMTLQLAETHRLLEEDPAAAREHVLEVQRLLAEEQRDLRFLVGELKSASHEAGEATLSLAARLESMRRQIQRQWGLRVELHMALPDAPLSTALAYEIYYIVHEALVNAARHAHASTVHVELGRQHDHLRITVADDGHGFPFQGRYDLAALTYLQLGPMMLRERIVSLGGSLALDSTADGARLDIMIPLTSSGGSEVNGARVCG